ncbi:unnamed protein product [Caenorhabditis bovis]|uniref:SAP domain-containing protein n=1 Tax=Caenorhabditis bovis TaxID=2654633 RepID=A0A8S1F7C8_9PELO|nr:unnamed protein product [Caenorhabditis bovis]
MSQFGGGKPPGQWGRPTAPGAAGQLPGFPAVNVGAFPMVGMGVPMGMVNQAAFSSPNVLGMQGIMGAVPQQSLAAQQQAGATSKNQRTFVGVVTKMHDTYGFVDDDVFFQHSVIRGAHPRVGDKVMVEANYNPAMPFKWNAYRIQLLNAASQAPPDPARPPPQQQMGSTRQAEQSRWGSDRNGRNESPPRSGNSSRRYSPPRRSPPRRSPPRRSSPKREIPRGRDSRDSRRSPPPRRASPPATRRSSPPSRSDRKRERSPTGSVVSSSVRRESASPPRRRARIIPRYECRTQKPVILSDVVSGNILRTRYTKLYLPSDFVDLTYDWIKTVQLDFSLDINDPVRFHVFHKDVEYFGKEPLPDIEPEDADHRHQVRVMLISHNGKADVVKKAFCLLADGSTDDHQEPQSIFKNLNFLVGVRGKEIMGIGGSWSPSLDGSDPHSPATLIKTAIRTTRALTGIDLTPVSQWFSMLQLRYYRSDKQRVDHVHLLFADTQHLVPDDAAWSAAELAIGEQYKQRLEVIDSMKIEEEVEQDEPISEDEKPKIEEVNKQEAPVETAPSGNDEAAKESIMETDNSNEVSMASENGDGEEDVNLNQSGPTNWTKLDPKSMKVAELRIELELRGLETKGIKTLLVQRLQTAIDAEKLSEKDNAANAAAAAVAPAAQDVEMKEVSPVKQEVTDENPAAFIAPPVEETRAKSEAEAKKEQKIAEDRKKKEEALEKEKKEKREKLEKHFSLPKEKKILVFPSKTYKSGKFDCKTVSMSTLLDYRADDNKEYQFEISLFAEAFREMLERNAAFTIYETLVNCGDKDIEKKRREEAREKPVEEPAKEATEPAAAPTESAEKEENGEAPVAEKDEPKKENKKEEKPVVEKIELKSLVANRTVYEAFSLYDANLCGYLLEKDIEEILYNGEFGISRGQIQKLAKKLSVRDKVNYRHLTDVLMDSDGNVRYTPGGADDTVETEDLIRGYGLALAKSVESGEKKQSESTTTATSDGIVVINGNVVNVPQKLKQLKTAEQERDAAKTTINEQISLIDQLREAKIDMEKKKKDIESIYMKTNKKLNEVTIQLKTYQDDQSDLKQALLDCKRYANRICGVVEKAIPPKEKEKSNSEKSEKSTDKKDEKSETSKEGSDEQQTEIVLAEEVGGDEEEKKDSPNADAATTKPEEIKTE